MELHQLRYFSVIAKYSNFSQAANDLAVAQPALSQSMKNLETDFGVELFVRTGKRISLSPCGVELQRRLQSILPQIESLPAVMQRIKRISSTTINIGITVSSSFFIPIIMDEFASQHPEINLRFHSSEKTFCDFVISSDLQDDDMLGLKILENQEFFLMVPENSELAEQESVKLVDLKDRKFILPTQNHSIRNIIDSCFKQAGFNPNVSVECDFLFMIPEMVRCGYGISVTTCDATADSMNIMFKLIASPVCTKDVYLTWRDNTIFTNSMNQFYKFMCGRFSESN